ncbi:helix-turn-helix domain-containing protein [Nocardia brasiliensis]|uniref:helix-turn-helix domain-containing protein n=1 Tax=Nocardia brasiliensis TaxID=37326 RepID=UPI0024544840|nr:helix-turn-helix transcriptional regulator [Nocardia brasiliensis]
MTESVAEARAAFGKRLREIRRSAGLTGRQLAGLTGWDESKVSKIEYGKTRPTEDDLRAYCVHARAMDQLPDLAASLSNIEASYLEWRRVLSTGTRRGQEESLKLAQQTTMMQVYQPFIIPGLLQTAEYARAVLREHIEFLGVPDDLEAGVAKRMERQELLYKARHRFRILIGEQALYTTVGDSDVMDGQLDRILSVMGLPTMVFGVVPAVSVPSTAPTNFVMFDKRMVTVETATAELTVTQPREIALYDRLFEVLAQRAVVGNAARALVTNASNTHRNLK